MDVSVTKKVTRKSCDKTHKGKFSGQRPSIAKKPKHPTKPKAEPRNCDRYAFDFTYKEQVHGWSRDDEEWRMWNQGSIYFYEGPGPIPEIGVI